MHLFILEKEKKGCMAELFITWKFKNKDWIKYSYCKNEKEFYSLMKKRYGVDKDGINIIEIKITNNNE